MKLIWQPPQGFHYRSNFITQQQEYHLWQFVRTLEFQEVWRSGRSPQRVTRQFGEVIDPEAEVVTSRAIPKELKGLKTKAAKFAGLAERDLSQVLITKYPPGSGVGWHLELPHYDQVMVSVLLGFSCLLQLRHRVGRQIQQYERILAARSAYALRGEARYNWQHRIAASDFERYSITFETGYVT